MTQTTFTELAQRVYDLPAGQMLHFKTFRGEESAFYGVIRLDIFDCDTILMSYYGGNNTSTFDATIDYAAQDIESWLREVVEASVTDVICVMDNAEVFPNRKELWGVTFLTKYSDGTPYRTQAISETSLFPSEEEAQRWIDQRSGGPFDSAFPAEMCSEPKAVLIDRWEEQR